MKDEMLNGKLNIEEGNNLHENIPYEKSIDLSKSADGLMTFENASLNKKKKSKKGSNNILKS